MVQIGRNSTIILFHFIGTNWSKPNPNVNLTNIIVRKIKYRFSLYDVKKSLGNLGGLFEKPTEKCSANERFSSDSENKIIQLALI